MINPKKVVFYIDRYAYGDGDPIRRATVEIDTKHFITINKGTPIKPDLTRFKKGGYWAIKLFPSWEAARAHLVDGMEKAISSGLQRIESSKRALAKYQAMKQPENMQ